MALRFGSSGSASRPAYIQLFCGAARVCRERTLDALHVVGQGLTLLVEQYQCPGDIVVLVLYGADMP
jgi:hypothetical protein